jgi:hypothetical protein
VALVGVGFIQDGAAVYKSHTGKSWHIESTAAEFRTAGKRSSKRASAVRNAGRNGTINGTVFQVKMKGANRGKVEG